MVAGLPTPRAHGTEDTERLTVAGARCAAIGDRLAALMDRDSRAYDLVVAAFRLPKSTEEERTARGIRIQEALRSATEAPLDVMRACADAIGLAAVVAAFGNRNASSDVHVGLELLRAGLRGAKLNVDVNLAGIKDETFAAAVRREAEHLVAEGEREVSTAVTRLESEP
jgi:formiminotetrahydrofolate cyclodeaminase